jgi:hypothetical protein
MSGEKFVSNSVILYDEKRSDYRAGEEIRIKIPATSVAVLSPRNTFLRFRVEITNSLDGNPFAMLPAILNSEIGGSALIRTLSIYSGDGTLLEQIDNYNLLAYIQSFYSTNETERNTKGLLEGATSTKNKAHNPFYEVIDDLAGVGAFTDLTRKVVELCIPLRLSGLLNPLNHNGSIPNIALGGMEVRILLEQNVEKILQLTTGACGDGRNDDKFMWDINNPCSRMGLGVVLADQDTTITLSVDGDAQAHAWDTEENYDELEHMASVPTMEWVSKNTPLLVGQALEIFDPITGDSQTTDSFIQSIAIAGNLVVLTFDNPITVGVVGGYPIGSSVAVAIAPQTWGYTLSECAMVCGVIKTDPKYISALANKSRGSEGVSFDIMTYNNYMVNHNANVLKQSLYIPMNEARCYSILSIPENIGETYTIQGGNGMRPAVGEPSNYHYIIKNIRVPNRNVSLRRIRETDLATNVVCYNEPVHSKELEDALLNNSWGVATLDRVDKAFCIGRGLSRYGHTFNARDSVGEVRLNLEYIKQPNSLLWNNFVSHLRRINVSSGGVVVQQ